MISIELPEGADPDQAASDIVGCLHSLGVDGVVVTVHRDPSVVVTRDRILSEIAHVESTSGLSRLRTMLDGTATGETTRFEYVPGDPLAPPDGGLAGQT